MTPLSTGVGSPGAASPQGQHTRAHNHRATMKDVAALAGVSLKTVSRVINGEPGVSEQLSTKVRDAAAQLSFRPNLGASSLRRSDGRTATVGVILQDLANPFSAALHRAIEDVAHERGVAVLAGSIDEDPQRERELVGAFASRRVDGLIVMPAGYDDSHFQREQAAGTPMVFVDREPPSIVADVVLSANREGARQGTEHLLAHGHRDIGFLGDLRSIATERERYAGYVDALVAAGLEPRPELSISGLDSMKASSRGVAALLAMRQPPTALLGAQNLITIGALRGLRAQGAQHRIALVGFDDFLLADLLDPPVTVVAQDAHKLGRRAAVQLFARIDGDESPARRDVVPTTLIARGSGEIRPS